MLDPARSRLYVAGTNVLYQLDDALRVSHKVETGPVLDSHECSATECSNGPTTKVDTDNHAKVLVLDARSDRLLLCGSVRQGACYRHSLTDITANTEQLLTAVAANTEAASTFGFIGPQQYNPWNSDDVLYVGTTFTQHGDYRHDMPAISSRNLDNLQFAEFSFSRQSLPRIDVMTSATSVSRPTLPQSRPEPAPASATHSLDLIDKNLFQADVETMIAAFNSLDSLSLHHGTLIGVTNTLGSVVRGLSDLTPA